jgi:hypothetical protein
MTDLSPAAAASLALVCVALATGCTPSEGTPEHPWIEVCTTTGCRNLGETTYLGPRARKECEAHAQHSNEGWARNCAEEPSTDTDREYLATFCPFRLWCYRR